MTGLKGKCSTNLHQFRCLTLSPLSGVAMNSKMRMLKLKRKTTMLILEKLHRFIPHGSPEPLTNISPTGAATDAPITHMAYNRFDDLITAQHSVVMKNWPLKLFCNPSTVASHVDLEKLYSLWKTGSTYFQQLTCEEMEAWENSWFSIRMELMPPPAESVPALMLPQTPAEPVSTLALPRPSTEMTLLSTLPRQDHSILAPHPLSNIPLAPITNLGSGSVPLTTPPNPDAIALMICTDPILQNVDPALIAMGITRGNQHQGTPTTATTSQIRQPSNRVSGANGLK